jgi:sugar/nucleoside kinase (ribokinase family)
LVSPNHIEALSLFGVKPSRDPRILAQQILKAAYELQHDLPTGKAVIVRAGVMGAFVCTRDTHGKMTSRIIPAYYGKEQQASVTDSTGKF